MAQAVQCEHVGPWRGQGVHAFEPSAATLRTLAKACLRMLWYPHAFLVSYQYILKKPSSLKISFQGRELTLRVTTLIHLHLTMQALSTTDEK